MKDTLYDPIRKKEVSATKEEYVRQDSIKYLINVVKVPEHLISVEFALGTIDRKSDERVDILVHNFRLGNPIDKPWLLVECKASLSYTQESLQSQLNRYLKTITPSYIMLALGNEKRFFKLNTQNNRYSLIDSLPKYE